MTGQVVPNWSARPGLAHKTLAGRFIRLEPLAPCHCDSLFASLQGHDALWDYLPYGPFDHAGLSNWIAETLNQDHTLLFALCDPVSEAALGVASYLRIEPEHGCAEVGHLNFSPSIQKTRAATEAMFLMMAHCFDLGYRRYEWKCNAGNLASRKAAQRLGFSFEGVFRQHRVSKGHNRDTAWFSVLDSEWPSLCTLFTEWMQDSNFNGSGRQITSLSQMTRPHLAQLDPVFQSAKA